jgi:hypothetical protein
MSKASRRQRVCTTTLIEVIKIAFLLANLNELSLSFNEKFYFILKMCRFRFDFVVHRSFVFTLMERGLSTVLVCIV